MRHIIDTDENKRLSRRDSQIISGLLSASMVISGLVIPGASVLASTSVDIDSKNFPDQHFRDYVAQFDRDEDGKFSEEELSWISNIECSCSEIETLKGVEFFTNLQILYCADNKLTELDISKNTNLVNLTCNNNQLKSIDLSQNKELWVINISNNQITDIDVSMLPNLYEFDCADNDITSIDVRSNQNLNSMFLMNNPIAELDLSNNPNLEILSAANMKITSLDVSKNTKLRALDFSQNNIDKIDLVNAPNIEILVFASTKVKSIDLSNFANLMSLDCGDNGIKSLDLSKNTKLANIMCDNNELTTLDLGNHKELEYIYCNDNQLTSINVGKSEALEELYCSNNKLTKLDLSANTKLNTLTCDNNELTTLDASNLNELIKLKCEHNKLTSLKLPKNDRLVYLTVHSNNLESLDLSDSYLSNSDWGINDFVYGTIASKVKTNRTDKEIYITDDIVDFKNNNSFLDFQTVQTEDGKEIEFFKYIFTTDIETKVTGASFEIATSEPTTTPNPDGATKAPSVEDFAERLYTTCLGREAEEDGKAYWTSELKAGKTGAEVAEGFFFSPEYEGRNLSNKDFIGTLYETFMGRTPADDEVAYWNSEMDSGKTRKDIFDGFVNSPEWANICLTYGIRSGGLAKPTFEKEASPAVKAFAERLYTTCLGRDAEKEGLEWWAAELANLRQTGTVAAQGFFYSPEFIGLKTDDNEYVTRLYKTFMGREPEEAGFKYWTDELKAGKDRQYVFDGFSVAPEFANLCAEAGIMR